MGSRAFYRSALWAASYLPLDTSYGVARAMGRARKNLDRGSVRPDPELVRALDATPDELRAWAARAAELRASRDLESILMTRASPHTLPRILRVEGVENLDAALGRKRGAILYSVHLWGKYTFFASLAELGYTLSVVARPVADPRRLQWMDKLAERFGFAYIWMGGIDAAVKAARVLGRNGVVIMMLDWPGSDRTDVDLLQRRARFTTGPAVVAASAGAPLLDFFIHRDLGRWAPQVAVIGPSIAASDSPKETLQRCATRLEPHIRREPAQWTFFSVHGHPTLLPSASAQEAA
jgi:lauroyl/myristoyl acyltransferase